MLLQILKKISHTPKILDYFITSYYKERLPEKLLQPVCHYLLTIELTKQVQDILKLHFTQNSYTVKI